MLMVRVDYTTREEVPFAGGHVAQSWKPWQALGVEASCEKLCGIELVDDVFRCPLGLQRVVNHRARTATRF